MIELSARIDEIVEALFVSEEMVLAKELLKYNCGENVPFCENNSPQEMDRIRIAALKISKGSYSELRRAVDLACLDWRDLLMEAGFGYDTEAHLKWLP
jgi:hypothetical protein